jgi:hypothetical protein
MVVEHGGQLRQRLLFFTSGPGSPELQMWACSIAWLWSVVYPISGRFTVAILGSTILFIHFLRADRP